jgi:fructokinase
VAQRHPDGQATIRRALGAARRAQALVVFDVNLRQRFYDREVIEQSLALSRWVKLNEVELDVLRGLLGLEGQTPSELLADLRQRYRQEVAALTLGSHGCLVQSDKGEFSIPGIAVTVVDTVGAGDAFTAGLLVSVLEGRSLGEAADFANRLAAKVAGCAGGTPKITRAELELELDR